MAENRPAGNKKPADKKPAQHREAGRNQKLKLLYLAKIFSEETDDSHGLTTPELIERLAQYGVRVERKILYEDMELLHDFGMDIIREKRGRSTVYFLGQRDFELSELKLLVDSVQAARFITPKKSGDLIKKLESLCSRYNAGQLHRQVTITGRVKSINEHIYYNVDMLHEAIEQGLQISFQYFSWNIRKEPELRHGGALYQVSPWALMWDDENYYLAAYNAAEDQIRHYRVDKMKNLSLLELPREGQDRFREFDLARYSNSLFGMFGGEETQVTLEADASMANVIVDRFGTDILLIPRENGRFRTTVTVAFSSQFLGWVFALGDKVRIVSPASAVEKVTEHLHRLAEQYGISNSLS